MEHFNRYDDFNEKLPSNGEWDRYTDRQSGNWFSFTFLCVVVVLIGFGLVCMYSASYNNALKNDLPGHYYVLRQAVFVLLGIAVSVGIRFIPMEFIKKMTPVILVVSVVLMLLTWIPSLGVSRLGARRWLEIGPLPAFQPSELLKISAIMMLARYFAEHGGKERLQIQEALFPVALVMVCAVLILAQKDYSTAMVFLGMGFSLFLIAGFPLSWLVLLLAALGVPAAIFLLLEPYRIHRLVSFLFPTIDPNGMNWQVSNSLKAIGSGGLWGKGLGKGVYKLGKIPEVQSDFIFANIGEEMGLFGMVLVLLFFLLFAVLGFRCYCRLHSRNRYQALLAFGITCMIVWQALVNIAVVTGLLPPTGIPLPFFSQGGTNLFVMICECGLLYKIIAACGPVPTEKTIHAQ